MMDWTPGSRSLRTCDQGHETLRPKACPVCRSLRDPRHKWKADLWGKQAASLRETLAIKRAAKAAALKAMAKLNLKTAAGRVPESPRRSDA